MKNPVMSRLVREQARVFARNMNRRRRELGMSRWDVAEKSGVSKSSIDNYENERVQPSALNVVLIARALGCTTDYLLGVEKEKR